MAQYRVVMMSKRDYNAWMAGSNQVSMIQMEVYVEAETAQDAMRKADGFKNKVAAYAIELGV